MDRLDRSFGTHGTALILQAERMQILASNIANAATPGYKARDIDFQSALGKQAQSIEITRTSAAHMTLSEADGRRPLYRVPVQPSLDGNSVELATEQLRFAETAVRYRSSLSFLNAQIATLTNALKGE